MTKKVKELRGSIDRNSGNRRAFLPFWPDHKYRLYFHQELSFSAKYGVLLSKGKIDRCSGHAPHSHNILGAGVGLAADTAEKRKTKNDIWGFPWPCLAWRVRKRSRDYLPDQATLIA